MKQPHVAPSDITYLVTEPPRYGYLALDTEDSEEAVTSFSQETVNSGRLQYVQATANQTKDYMIVDVTNGITWLRQLVVRKVLDYFVWNGAKKYGIKITIVAIFYLVQGTSK